MKKGDTRLSILSRNSYKGNTVKKGLRDWLVSKSKSYVEDDTYKNFDLLQARILKPAAQRTLIEIEALIFFL